MIRPKEIKKAKDVDTSAVEDDDDEIKEKVIISNEIDYFSYIMLCILAIITVWTFPGPFIEGKVSSLHVWYFSWLTAISTGLGLFCFSSHSLFF